MLGPGEHKEHIWIESVRQTSQIIKDSICLRSFLFFHVFFLTSRLEDTVPVPRTTIYMALYRCAVRIACFGGQCFYGSIQNKRGPI